MRNYLLLTPGPLSTSEGPYILDFGSSVCY